MPRAALRLLPLVLLPLACTPTPKDDPVEVADGGGVPHVVQYQQSQGLNACVGAALEAGMPVPAGQRCRTFRAIAGVSMGGGASSRMGFHYADLFDVVGVMGTPFADHVHLWGMLAKNHLGGFCSRQQILDVLAANPEHPEVLDNPETPGLWCGRSGNEIPGDLAIPDSQCWEYASDFNHWYRGPDTGRGGGFTRPWLLATIQDLALIYGNVAFHNPVDPAVPPGVPSDYRVLPRLDWSAQQARRRAICDNPVVLQGVRNQEYNPDGSFPVVTFCDCTDCASDYPPGANDVPFELLLAVDYNRNGRRDWGEPTIAMPYERFQDVGPDGKETGEAGDDPTDEYDPFTNPTGHAHNEQWDEGEPFADDGLDGVPDTGDYGEGDGVFTMAPTFQRMMEDGPRAHLARLQDAAVQRLDVYMEAGLRDFINSAQVTNRLYGALHARVPDTRLYRDLSGLVGEPPLSRFNPTRVDFSAAHLGQNAYVLYGDPAFCPGTSPDGDGNHVGSNAEVYNRLLTTLAFADARLVDGDRTNLGGDSGGDTAEGLSAHLKLLTYPSTALGRDQEYGIVLPPGYFAPQNATKRYPVVYFFAGQGQGAEDMLGSGVLWMSFMNTSSTGNLDYSDWQKMIIVFPDGKCLGNECHTGNFFADYQVGVDGHGPQYEQAFLELMRLVDATYRTRLPELK